jgi:hypothetical protein
MFMKAKEPNTDEMDFDPEEVATAASEITDLGVEPPPETVPGTENVTTWDEAPDSSGHVTPKYSLDKEENQIGQDLVEGGVESADRDQRLAAADPDYEP